MRRTARKRPPRPPRIETLIAAGEETGLIEKDDREQIQSVVVFGDTVVREVMTPRPTSWRFRRKHLEELAALGDQEQYSASCLRAEHRPDYRVIHVRDMFALDERVAPRAGCAS